MNKNEIFLTKVLIAEIKKQEFIIQGSIEDIDWEQVYTIAVSHQVHTLVYPLFSRLDKNLLPNNKLLLKWRDTTIISGLSLLANYKRTGLVLSNLHNAGIPVIALKGLVLNYLYPRPELRIMCDADILINESDFTYAIKIITDMGYTAEKYKGTKHIVFYHSSFMAIELHKKLIDTDIIKNKEQFNKKVWNNLREINIHGASAFAMAWEQQVLHVCLHMAVHMKNEGISLRQLCDLVLIVVFKKSEIDWEFVNIKFKEHGIDKFAQVLFQVCNLLFEMEIPFELTNKLENNDAYIEKFIADIFQSEYLSRNDMDRQVTNILLKNSNINNRNLYKNKLFKILSLLFPSYKKLSSRYKYMYVKKYAILMPFAWVHRILYGILRKDFTWKYKITIFNNDNLLRKAEERDDLLNWFELR